MELPLVSVMIPTYNYGCYIKKAIDSIINQNYPLDKLEIVVVDDGSSDDTQQVLQPLIDGKIIQYHYQQNQGKAGATYQAVQKCTGKYIFNLDADDYYLQDKISTYVRIFESDGDIVHVAAPNRFFHQSTLRYEDEKMPSRLLAHAIDGNKLLLDLYNNNIIFGGGSTYAARASVIQKVIIPKSVDMFIDEFLLLAVLPFGKSYFLNKPYSVWRVHTSNFSSRALTKEKLIKHELRLLMSSGAILDYLIKNDFNKKLISIYKVLDATRKISFKESLGDKNISDIFHYSIDMFFKIHPGWQIIKKYNVLNRMAPNSMVFLVRKVKRLLVAKKLG